MDIKQIQRTCKKASARIRQLEAENKSLISKAGKQSKYASLVRGGKRKVGEVVAEVVEDVKNKLEELKVPEEAVAQATEIVETAVAEAVSEAGTEGTPATEEAAVADVIDQETKDELAQVASSDEIEDEEVKSAAAKLLKSCNSKQAFGKELIRLVKKMSAVNFSGSVVPTRPNVGSGRKSPALQDLQDFARNSK